MLKTEHLPRQAWDEHRKRSQRAVFSLQTLRGSISVKANKTHTVVGVPCGASARICVAHGLEPGDQQDSIAAKVLLLDGEVVDSGRVVLEFAGRHLCADDVGCGAAGANRTLTLA